MDYFHPSSEKARHRFRSNKTAKLNDRHIVIHSYRDHANATEDATAASTALYRKNKGGVEAPFPQKLYQVLEQVETDGMSHIISWQPHGRCFVIHKPKQFAASVMPKYFKQTKLTSFQRQLNLYGFCRLTRGPDSTGYYHELFLRGKPFLARRMMRTRVKGTKIKGASNPDGEPDFYDMPPVHGASAAVIASDDDDSATNDITSLQVSPQYVRSSVRDSCRPPLSNQALTPSPVLPSRIDLSRTTVMVGHPQTTHSAPPDLSLSEEDPVDTLLMELQGEDPDLFLGCFHRLDTGHDALVNVLESDVALGSMLDRMLEDEDRQSASV